MWSLREALSFHGLMTLSSRNISGPPRVEPAVCRRHSAACTARLGQDAKERRVAVRYPVPECKSADKDGEAGENAVEEVESAHGAHADEVKQRALDAQIRERLMQALEDAICANWLLLLFRHRPLELRCDMSTPISTEWSAFRRPTARSEHSPREQQCLCLRQRRRAPSSHLVRRERNHSRQSQSQQGLQPSRWCR